MKLPVHADMYKCMQLMDLHIIFNSMQDSVLLKKATSFIVTTSKLVNKVSVLHLI